MKNADMPAMPSKAEVSDTDEAFAYQFDHGSKFHFPGLTKREMFAMHAPDCPKWFEREFFIKHIENKEWFQCFTDEYSDVCPTTTQEILPKGQMALMKAWRYAYADLMLGEE